MGRQPGSVDANASPRYNRPMPELPEVETVRGAMEMHLVGKTITTVGVSAKRLREPLPRTRLQTLRGQRFVGARRRAKYLLLDLDDGRVLLVHLGMSGNLLLRESGRKHDHLVLGLDAGPPLVFEDPRRFGMVLVLEPAEIDECRYLCGLGVEPLDEVFDGPYLRQMCRGRSRPIKNVIMDGRIVVGVGNIYASESLFRAGVRPTTPAAKLGAARADRLVCAIKEILSAAVRAGGTSVRTYQGAGAGGRFQQQLSVYGRAGKSCLVCDGTLDSQVLAGRSTYFCRRCQR
jgi:formamidopyrimidine-DNA glycosylase